MIVSKVQVSLKLADNNYQLLYMANNHVPTQMLSLSFLNRPREENKLSKFISENKDREIVYHHWQNRVDLSKVNLISYWLKWIHVVTNKDIKTTTLFFLFFISSLLMSLAAPMWLGVEDVKLESVCYAPLQALQWAAWKYLLQFSGIFCSFSNMFS